MQDIISKGGTPQSRRTFITAAGMGLTALSLLGVSSFRRQSGTTVFKWQSAGGRAAEAVLKHKQQVEQKSFALGTATADWKLSIRINPEVAQVDFDISGEAIAVKLQRGERKDASKIWFGKPNTIHCFGYGMLSGPQGINFRRFPLTITGIDFDQEGIPFKQLQRTLGKVVPAIAPHRPGPFFWATDPVPPGTASLSIHLGRHASGELVLRKDGKDVALLYR